MGYHNLLLVCLHNIAADSLLFSPLIYSLSFGHQIIQYIQFRFRMALKLHGTYCVLFPSIKC